MTKPNNRDLWEQRYRQGAGRIHYPFDHVVSFVLSHYGRSDRSAIRVLDFGCGPGNHLWFLAENGFQAFGIDSAPTAIELAQTAVARVAPDYPVSDRILTNDGLKIPFDDSFFDAVIDRSCLGQNPADDIPVLVDEIHRVLKPNGRYLGINFSDQHSDLVHGRAVGGGDFADFMVGVFKGVGKRHFFSVAEIFDLFGTFELEDVRMLEERSLLEGGAQAQILVRARKKE